MGNNFTFELWVISRNQALPFDSLCVIMIARNLKLRLPLHW
jgi:hypothetical protein